MNRQKTGQVMFWAGVVGVIAMQALTWFQQPVQRLHTAEELAGTPYAIWGAVWWIRNAGAWGFMLALMGVLLQTGEKGSYFWLVGFLPNAALGAGMYWQPSRYMAELFGIGGAAILISYFVILWAWTRTSAAYEGAARAGRRMQLLGYSFLVVTGLLLCMYFGNPKVLAIAELPAASAESINLSLAISMLLLAVGHTLEARNTRRA
jgi:hypothetical protein